MTNEEKARKIVWDLFDDGLFYHKYESQRQEIQSAIIKMAEWKDRQKEAEKEALINKACEWLEHNVWVYTGFDSYELSEAFKNAMEEEEKGGNNE